MLEKFSEQELKGFIDLYKNLNPRTKEQKFQSRLLATIIELQKDSKSKTPDKKTAIYKKALQNIVKKYAPSNGAVKIASEALNK